MFRKLRVAFETLNDFQREYQRNMANGGMFVPTEEPFEFREVIELELELTFCDKLLLLQSEVVSRIGHSFGDHPGLPGVAVQFLEPIDELRHVLTEAAGMAQAASGREAGANWVQRSGPARRHDRVDAHAAAHVRSEFGELEGRTRNLSRSGTLVAVDGEAPPLGTSVRLTLVHPRTQQMREVQAKVVRQGEPDPLGTQLALEFEFRDQETEDFVQDICFRGEPRPASAITGPIEILGLPSLVQMFATCDQGTLDVWSSGLHGRIVFAGGGLQFASASGVTGMKAMCRILAWDQGSFEFRPIADSEQRMSEPVPMYGAILEGLQHLDEFRHLDLSSLPAAAIVERTAQASPSDLEKTEQMLLDLLEPGMTVEALVSRAPGFDSEAYQALISLCDRELLQIT